MISTLCFLKRRTFCERPLAAQSKQVAVLDYNRLCFYKASIIDITQDSEASAQQLGQKQTMIHLK